MDTHQISEPSADQATNLRRLRWGLSGFLAIALYFLLVEHRAHLFSALPWLFGVLPWLLLLACPLIHLFMHRGHRPRHEGGGSVSSENVNENQKEHQHAGHGCC